jgi:ankyrin repeat protein
LELLELWERETPGTTDQIKTFLNQGRIGAVDLNAKSRISGTTLLHEAVRRKDADLIKLAVRRGADVFVRNKRGKRVLESTKDEKIKALLQQCEWKWKGKNTMYANCFH